MFAELLSCSWDETSCIYRFSIINTNRPVMSSIIGIRWYEKTGPVVIDKWGNEIFSKEFKQRILKATGVDRFINKEEQQ